MDVLAMENDIIETILSENDTEDFGDREPGRGRARQDLLLIGMDENIRVIMEKERQRERLYVSRAE